MLPKDGKMILKKRWIDSKDKRLYLVEMKNVTGYANNETPFAPSSSLKSSSDSKSRPMMHNKNLGYIKNGEIQYNDERSTGEYGENDEEDSREVFYSGANSGASGEEESGHLSSVNSPTKSFHFEERFTVNEDWSNKKGTFKVGEGLVHYSLNESGELVLEYYEVNGKKYEVKDGKVEVDGQTIYLQSNSISTQEKKSSFKVYGKYVLDPEGKEHPIKQLTEYEDKEVYISEIGTHKFYINSEEFFVLNLPDGFFFVDSEFIVKEGHGEKIKVDFSETVGQTIEVADEFLFVDQGETFFFTTLVGDYVIQDENTVIGADGKLYLTEKTETANKFKVTIDGEVYYITIGVSYYLNRLPARSFIADETKVVFEGKDHELEKVEDEEDTFEVSVGGVHYYIIKDLEIAYSGLPAGYKFTDKETLVDEEGVEHKIVLKNGQGILTVDAKDGAIRYFVRTGNFFIFQALPAGFNIVENRLVANADSSQSFVIQSDDEGKKFVEIDGEQYYFSLFKTLLFKETPSIQTNILKNPHTTQAHYCVVYEKKLIDFNGKEFPIKKISEYDEQEVFFSKTTTYKYYISSKRAFALSLPDGFYFVDSAIIIKDGHDEELKVDFSETVGQTIEVAEEILFVDEGETFFFTTLPEEFVIKDQYHVIDADGKLYLTEKTETANKFKVTIDGEVYYITIGVSYYLNRLPARSFIADETKVVFEGKDHELEKVEDEEDTFEVSVGGVHYYIIKDLEIAYSGLPAGYKFTDKETLVDEEGVEHKVTYEDGEKTLKLESEDKVIRYVINNGNYFIFQTLPIGFKIVENRLVENDDSSQRVEIETSEDGKKFVEIDGKIYYFSLIETYLFEETDSDEHKVFDKIESVHYIVYEYDVVDYEGNSYPIQRIPEYDLKEVTIINTTKTKFYIDYEKSFALNLPAGFFFVDSEFIVKEGHGEKIKVDFSETVGQTIEVADEFFFVDQGETFYFTTLPVDFVIKDQNTVIDADGKLYLTEKTETANKFKVTIDGEVYYITIGVSYYLNRLPARSFIADETKVVFEGKDHELKKVEDEEDTFEVSVGGVHYYIIKDLEIAYSGLPAGYKLTDKETLVDEKGVQHKVTYEDGEKIFVLGSSGSKKKYSFKIGNHFVFQTLPAGYVLIDNRFVKNIETSEKFEIQTPTDGGGYVEIDGKKYLFIVLDTFLFDSASKLSTGITDATFLVYESELIQEDEEEEVAFHFKKEGQKFYLDKKTKTVLDLPKDCSYYLDNTIKFDVAQTRYDFDTDKIALGEFDLAGRTVFVTKGKNFVYTTLDKTYTLSKCGKFVIDEDGNQVKLIRTDEDSVIETYEVTIEEKKYNVYFVRTFIITYVFKGPVFSEDALVAEGETVAKFEELSDFIKFTSYNDKRIIVNFDKLYGYEGLDKSFVFDGKTTVENIKTDKTYEIVSRDPLLLQKYIKIDNTFYFIQVKRFYYSTIFDSYSFSKDYRKVSDSDGIEYDIQAGGETQDEKETREVIIDGKKKYIYIGYYFYFIEAQDVLEYDHSTKYTISYVDDFGNDIKDSMELLEKSEAETALVESKDDDDDDDEENSGKDNGKKVKDYEENDEDKDVEDKEDTDDEAGKKDDSGEGSGEYDEDDHKDENEKDEKTEDEDEKVTKKADEEEAEKVDEEEEDKDDDESGETEEEGKSDKNKDEKKEEKKDDEAEEEKTDEEEKDGDVTEALKDDDEEDEDDDEEEKADEDDNEEEKDEDENVKNDDEDVEEKDGGESGETETKEKSDENEDEAGEEKPDEYDAEEEKSDENDVEEEKPDEDNVEEDKDEEDDVEEDKDDDGEDEGVAEEEKDDDGEGEDEEEEKKNEDNDEEEVKKEHGNETEAKKDDEDGDNDDDDEDDEDEDKKEKKDDENKKEVDGDTKEDDEDFDGSGCEEEAFGSGSFGSCEKKKKDDDEKNEKDEDDEYDDDKDVESEDGDENEVKDDDEKDDDEEGKDKEEKKDKDEKEDVDEEDDDEKKEEEEEDHEEEGEAEDEKDIDDEDEDKKGQDGKDDGGDEDEEDKKADDDEEDNEEKEEDKEKKGEKVKDDDEDDKEEDKKDGDEEDEDEKKDETKDADDEDGKDDEDKEKKIDDDKDDEDKKDDGDDDEEDEGKKDDDEKDDDKDDEENNKKDDDEEEEEDKKKDDDEEEEEDKKKDDDEEDEEDKKKDGDEEDETDKKKDDDEEDEEDKKKDGDEEDEKDKKKDDDEEEEEDKKKDGDEEDEEDKKKDGDEGEEEDKKKDGDEGEEEDKKKDDDEEDEEDKKKDGDEEDEEDKKKDDDDEEKDDDEDKKKDDGKGKKDDGDEAEKIKKDDDDEDDDKDKKDTDEDDKDDKEKKKHVEDDKEKEDTDEDDKDDGEGLETILPELVVTQPPTHDFTEDLSQPVYIPECRPVEKEEEKFEEVIVSGVYTTLVS